MARNLTPKQESFVAAYLKTGNASEAYRQAYNASKMKPEVIHVKACELLKSGNVAVRLSNERARLAKRFEITQEKLVEMLLEDREFARKLENASAAAQATMGLAKITGHTVEDRRNVRSPLQDIPTETLEQLEQALAEHGIAGVESPRPAANRVTH